MLAFAQRMCIEYGDDHQARFANSGGGENSSTQQPKGHRRFCLRWAINASISAPLLAAAMVLFAVGGLEAAEISKASTSRAAREDAVGTIPFDRLDEATQAKLWSVVSKPSIYRRMPLQLVECDPDLYLFLVRYPEVVVNIWDMMGITNVTIDRVGPFTFDASDGSGTTTRVELVYGDADTHILYAEGTYEGPFFKKKIDGRCVLVLKSGYLRGDNGHVQVTSRLDLFVQFDQIGAELLAKTLHPLVGRSADFNFSESTGFLGRISQESERNGPGVSQLVSKLSKIEPEVRARFSKLTEAVSHKAVLQAAAAEDPSPTSPAAPTKASLEALYRPVSSPVITR